MGKKYRTPSISALVAFESAARLLNFSEAAKELNTSQSAISRHIQGIEGRFNAQLFERRQQKRHRLHLTEQGEQYYRAIAAALEGIHVASETLSHTSTQSQLTIACTHEVSHMVLMPKFDALQKTIGADVPVRIMTFEYDAMQSSLDPRIDLVFSYGDSRYLPEAGCVVFKEAIQPVCSPAFFEANKEILSGPVSGWGELDFLKLTKPSPNKGWASWEDLFKYYGLVDFRPNYINYDNYIYLLEAAAAGKGVGLGWQNMVDRHLDEGILMTLGNEYVPQNSALFTMLTEKGKDHRCASQLLDFFSSSE